MNSFDDVIGYEEEKFELERMNRKDITELLTLLGANVNDSVTKNTTYLIVGEAPGAKKLSTALNYGTKIITEGHFAKMLSESAVGEGDNA